MTIIFTEDFTGTNGSAWDVSAWNTQRSSGTGGFTRQDSLGMITVPGGGGYGDRMQAQTTATLTGGEYRYDFPITTKVEYTVAFVACGAGSLESWTHLTQNGYVVNYAPITGALTLQKVASWAPTTLASGSLAVDVNDMVHVAIRPGAGAYVWKNGDARPGSPTLASADSTYASGSGGFGVIGGNAAATIPLFFDNVILDDLDLVAGTDFFAATSDGLAPLETVFA